MRPAFTRTYVRTYVRHVVGYQTSWLGRKIGLARRASLQKKELLCWAERRRSGASIRFLFFGFTLRAQHVLHNLFAALRTCVRARVRTLCSLALVPDRLKSGKQAICFGALLKKLCRLRQLGGRRGSCRECGGNSRAAGSGHVRLALRRRGQGASARGAETGFPSRRPCASGSDRRPGAPRAASARFPRRAARSGS